MSEIKQRFTTAEFARLCGVKKDTLFHYDEIGIFSPAERGAENRYRYYTYPQLEVFNVIWMLKELGMKLSEIKAYLRERSPAALVSLLKRQSLAIDQKLRKLESEREFIRRKIETTEKSLSAEPGKISFHREPARSVFLLPVGGKDDASLAKALLRLYDLCEARLVYPHFMGGILRAEEVARGNVGTYSHVYVTSPESYPECERLEAGLYASLYWEGYEQIGRAYSLLAEGLREGGMLPDSDFFEDTMLDELSVRGCENYLYRLSVRVRSPEP